ncbi:MAG: DUF4124 domain-containing protein [Burkholderiaceae bacterium]
MIRQLACLVLLLAGFTGAADAQYQWRDDRGRMVFSDRPPPAGTPADRILRAPRPPAAAPAAAAAQTAPAAGMAANPAGFPATEGIAATGRERAAPSYKDQSMAFEKRRLERAENEAKAANAAREAADKARYCDELETQRRTLASGARISTVGADGQRQYLGDDARKLRLEQNAEALAGNCRG